MYRVNAAAMQRRHVAAHSCKEPQEKGATNVVVCCCFACERREPTGRASALRSSFIRPSFILCRVIHKSPIFSTMVLRTGPFVKDFFPLCSGGLRPLRPFGRTEPYLALTYIARRTSGPARTRQFWPPAPSTLRCNMSRAAKRCCTAQQSRSKRTWHESCMSPQTCAAGLGMNLACPGSAA